MPEMTETELAEFRSGLEEILTDVDQAISDLPADERDAYEDAQRSVIDARRKAETHEGLLQVN